MGKAKGVVENRWYIPYDDVPSGESISSTLPPKTTNSIEPETNEMYQRFLQSVI